MSRVDRLLQRLRLCRIDELYRMEVAGLSPLPAPEGAQWRRLSTGVEMPDHLPPDVARRFREFAAQGAIGIALERDGRFIAYGWMTLPATALPHHLPSSLGQHYWIFGCRTIEEWRGRGLYTAVVHRLTAEACTLATPHVARVHIDTGADNVAAVRAIRRLGFTWIGQLAVYRVPRTRFRWGRWVRRPAPGTDDGSTHPAVVIGR